MHTLDGFAMVAALLAFLGLYVWIRSADRAASLALGENPDDVTAARIQKYLRGTIVAFNLIGVMAVIVGARLSAATGQVVPVIAAFLLVVTIIWMNSMSLGTRVLGIPRVSDRQVTIVGYDGLTVLSPEDVRIVNPTRDQDFVGPAVRAMSTFESGPAAVIVLSDPQDSTARYLVVGDNTVDFIRSVERAGFPVNGSVE